MPQCKLLQALRYDSFAKHPEEEHRRTNARKAQDSAFSRFSRSVRPWAFMGLDAEIPPSEPVVTCGGSHFLKGDRSTRHGQPMNAHGRALPMNAHGRALPMNAHGRALPMNAHGRALPMNAHGRAEREKVRRPVSRVLSPTDIAADRRMAIHLGHPLPDASRDQPGRRRGNPLGQSRGPRLPKERMVGPAIPIRSCSRWGLPCHPRCRRRGALLPHPFTLTAGRPSPALPDGGLLSVALSLGSPPPAVSRHRVSVEPGLSSPGLSSAQQSPYQADVPKRPSGRLTRY